MKSTTAAARAMTDDELAVALRALPKIISTSCSKLDACKREVRRRKRNQQKAAKAMQREHAA